MRQTIFILGGFILLLLIADFAAERPPERPHPIKELHPEAQRVPVFYGKADLWVCSDSVATLWGHRAMEDWEREAFEEYQKPL